MRRDGGVAAVRGSIRGMCSGGGRHHHLDPGNTPAPTPVDTDTKAEDPEGDANQPEPQPAPQPAPTRSATISVNGAEHEVAVGGTFPEDDPIFKLVSLKGGTAKVGIVGGSYANGSTAITLKRGGKPVTLMNTADGTTYVLRFVA